MMRVIKSELVNDIIKNILPEAILNQKPIVAGGSVLSLYRHFVMNDWSLVKAPVVKDFGDIDCWFLKDNPVHQSFELSFLFDNIPNDIEKKTNYVSQLNRLGYQDRFVKSSKWANTFIFSPNPFLFGCYFQKYAEIDYQIVKTKPESIKELLDSFDINIVSIAWHDGNIYISKRAEEALSEDGEIEIKNSIVDGRSSLQKVYSVIRAFKHAHRSKKSFSQQTTDDVFNLYLDNVNGADKCFGLKIVDEEITVPIFSIIGITPVKQSTKKVVVDFEQADYDEDAEEESSSSLDTSSGLAQDLLSSYEKEDRIDVDFIKDLYYTLIGYFEEFIRMKHFDPAKLYYFVESNDFVVKSVIQTRMNPIKSISESDLPHIPF